MRGIQDSRRRVVCVKKVRRMKEEVSPVDISVAEQRVIPPNMLNSLRVMRIAE